MLMAIIKFIYEVLDKDVSRYLKDFQQDLAMLAFSASLKATVSQD